MQRIDNHAESDQGEGSETVVLNVSWQEFNHLFKIAMTVGQEYRYLSAPCIAHETVGALSNALYRLSSALPDDGEET